MDSEMKQHEEVGTWKLVELPAGKNVVGSRWVYAAKTNAQGVFELGKARVVAQGFTQRPGMDYFDVTSPVIKLESLRIMLALAIQNAWAIEMMDVKGAYLNSVLEEEIYMCQQEGFDDGSGHILKLSRAIYGLKQSGRAWYKRLSTVLLNDGFTRSHADDCVFFKKEIGQMSIIFIYVDDLGLLANTITLMARIKTLLRSNFTMKDLGEMQKILGIKVDIDQHSGTIKLSQGHYIDVIVQRSIWTRHRLWIHQSQKTSSLWCLDQRRIRTKRTIRASYWVPYVCRSWLSTRYRLRRATIESTLP
jgi:hypothetical protein